MPHPDRRPQFVIADELGAVHVWRLVDAGVGVRIQCDACGHTADWSPDLMDKRFKRRRGHTLNMIAARLRCSRCRSEFVHIWRAPADGPGPGWSFDPRGGSPFKVGS